MEGVEGTRFRTSIRFYVVRFVLIQILFFIIIWLYTTLTRNLPQGILVGLFDKLLIIAFIFELLITICTSLYGWYTTNYFITDDAIELKKGMILKSSNVYFPFTEIESSNVTRSLFGRFWGYADLTIHFKDEAMREDVTLAAIPNADQLAAVIRQHHGQGQVINIVQPSLGVS